MQCGKDKLYMILDTQSRKYKAQGANSRFTRQGKVWRGGLIKNHLRLHQQQYNRRGLPLPECVQRDYSTFVNVDDCEVVEVQLTPVKRVPLRQFLEEMDDDSR